MIHPLFIYIQEYNLLFCMPPKVGIECIIYCHIIYSLISLKAGSTTWMGGIFPKFSKLESKFAGKELDKSKGLRSYLQHQVNVKNIKELELILKKNPFAFTNVRHPFERLVSAYVDVVVKVNHRSQLVSGNEESAF